MRIYVAVACICFWTLSSGDAADVGPLEKLYPPAAAAIVKSPTTVTAYRLAESSFYQAKVADYKTKGDAVDVGGETAKSLSAALLDPRGYLWDAAKGCEPIYGVRLQFTRKDESVDVLFCFECDILTVYHNGTALDSEDFDPLRPALIAAMKKIFPDDGEIQSLNARSP